jgi:hypothetical protein
MIGANAPATAEAANSPVVADCTSHGRLTHHYSVTELHTALTELPTDIQEYTNCYALIQRALLAQVSSSRPGDGKTSQGSSGGSFLPLPVVVILAILGVSAAGFGALALRRR